MKKDLRKRLAVWIGMLFVVTQIISTMTINASTEEEESKKYGRIEHYNGILFGDDALVSYDGKDYAYTSKGGDNEGSVAVGGDLYTPYLDNSMDFGASAAPGYTGIGNKYEDNGMPTVMTSGKWYKKDGSNINIYGSEVNKVLLSEEYNQGFTVSGADVKYSSSSDIKNAISNFKKKVLSTIEYTNNLEVNGYLEDNINGKNIVTKTESDNEIIKVVLDSGEIPSLDLKKEVNLDKKYVIYCDAEKIQFNGGGILHGGEPVWGSGLTEDSSLFKIAKNVIWVLPNATSIEISGYAVIGSVVAPKAMVHCKGSSINGQLFASSLHQEGGFELHNFTSNWDWDLDLEPKGVIGIEKVDSQNSEVKLSGAEFEIRDLKDNVVDTLITNDAGRDNSILLPYGEYIIRETKAPEGYELSTEKITVTVNSEKVVYKTITNKKAPVIPEIKNGTIGIEKVDSENSEIKLSGAIFEIRDLKGNVVDTLITNDEGRDDSISLPYGKYIIVETKAPEGYILDDFSQNIVINDEEDEILLEVKNVKEVVPEDNYPGNDDSEEIETTLKEENENSPVKTGDGSGDIWGVGTLSLLSLIAMLLSIRKFK